MRVLPSSMEHCAQDHCPRPLHKFAELQSMHCMRYIALSKTATSTTRLPCHRQNRVCTAGYLQCDVCLRGIAAPPRAPVGGSAGRYSAAQAGL